MEIELILTGLHTFKFSHFGSFFCIVGYGDCVINSSYSFQWTFLKIRRRIADI